ncbi:MAG: hypothetical protein PHI78_02700 [Clostridia bacterium]|nr:hypothetical protein [Clostridia bacterium]
MRDKAYKYLKKHGQTSDCIDADMEISAFLKEMEKGLKGENSSLEMIPSYLPSTFEIVKNKRNIVIDAGGTNFRSAIAYFNNKSECVLEEMRKTVMAGVGKEVSKARFYDHIAYNIKHLVGKGENIGFCFSYNVDTRPDLDGTVKAFAKEVRAKEVVGTKVGACTLEALKKYDDTPRKIAVLNDTVACLLGGKGANLNDECSSYLGYIYGTGTNVSYVEQNKNIKKISGVDLRGDMVINTECGNYNKFPSGTFDKITDKESSAPNKQLAEKMTSGRYLSMVIYNAVIGAQKENLFTGEVVIPVRCFADTATISDFLTNPENNVNRMRRCFYGETDRRFVREIALQIIDRAAKIGAIMVTACMVKSGGGTPDHKPIGIVVEGTTFSKLYSYREKFTAYLDEYCAKRNLSYKIITGKNLNLVGTALAALSL